MDSLTKDFKDMALRISRKIDEETFPRLVRVSTELLHRLHDSSSNTSILLDYFININNYNYFHTIDGYTIGGKLLFANLDRVGITCIGLDVSLQIPPMDIPISIPNLVNPYLTTMQLLNSSPNILKKKIIDVFHDHNIIIEEVSFKNDEISFIIPLC